MSATTIRQNHAKMYFIHVRSINVMFIDFIIAISNFSALCSSSAPSLGIGIVSSQRHFSQPESCT